MSKKCKYALKALVYLGKRHHQGPVFTADIATEENIPRKFLEQILLELKRAHLVNSRQGSKGGYYLLKPPSAILLADIYRLFDGPIALVPCASLYFYERCDDCADEASCPLRQELIKVREATRQVMSQTSIQSFIDSGAPHSFSPSI